MSKTRAIKKYATIHQTIVRNFVIILYILGFIINQFQILPFVGYSSIYFALLSTFALSFSCFIAACIINPGEVPKEWDDSETKYAFINMTTYELPIIRYCMKCEHVKPPRTHHCKVCRKCILKMDHHCPWIANCVGHRNHKIFVLSLFYNVLSQLILSSILIYRFSLIYIHRNETDHYAFIKSKADIFFHFILLLLNIFCLTFSFYVLRYQYAVIKRNSTSIEELKIVTMQHIIKRKMIHPYDEGLLSNLYQLFGKNPLIWLIPTLPTHNGIHWTYSHKYKRFLSELPNV